MYYLRVLFVYIVMFGLYFLNYQCYGANTVCNPTEKSHGKKFNDSLVVVIGKFLQFKANGHSDPTVQNAQFYLERRLKGQLLHNPDGTFLVPLYRGHNAMSKQVYCLSEKMLVRNRRYMLFLNHVTNSRNNKLIWKSVFTAEKHNENSGKFL